MLQVSFPGGCAAHTRRQYSYFGEDGLLRRHLYTVDVLGGAQGANYASEYRAVNGVRLATRRRVVAYDDVSLKGVSSLNTQLVKLAPPTSVAP